MTVLIDADSLIYVIAWTYRELGTDEEVKRSCDSVLRDILDLTQADNYIGVFSDSKTFRHSVYRYAPYKGNRKEKPEWVTKWQDLIKGHFCDRYGFTLLKDLEADDVVAACSLLMQEAQHDCIICSPDKDLRQVPGLLYVPKKQSSENGEVTTLEGQIVRVSEEEAHYNFWLQMICGDSSDNVAGIPGLGEVKGKKLLADCMDPIMYQSAVLGAYVKYFGTHYGRQIFEETLHTLMLVHSKHALWEQFKGSLELVPGIRRPYAQIGLDSVIFDLPS
jgi:5'-3' exonuclease